MKNIHEILAELGVTVPDDKKTALDKALLENYKTVADYGKQSDKLKLAEEKVTTTEEALKAFDGVDVADLKGKIATLTNDLASKDTEYQGKLADMEFDNRLTAAITGAKGRSSKAVTALLDMDTLKASKNQAADLKAALEALKKDNGYLFEDAETPPPYAPGAGTHKIIGDVTKESFAKMGYNERLDLKQSNPEIYKQMKE